MRIAIDARWIFPQISGIGAYTRELIRHLAMQDRENEYLLLFDNPDLLERTHQEARLADAPNMTTELLPYGLFSLAGQFRLPVWLKQRRIRVFHSPNYMIPFLAFPRRRPGAVRCVATLHDVIPMIFPHHAPRSRKARLYPLYRRLMIEVGARADRIVSDSAASAVDVVRHLRIPQSDVGKVRPIYCGVAERFRPAADPALADPDTPPDQDGPSPEPKERTVLYMGRADPYKNLETVVRAFAGARRQVPFPLTLTLAGAADARYPEALTTARELGVDQAVHWTGYLSDDDVVATYRRADVLVHASRYEGFGLQVAEAMACGTPVICSTAGALPEVAGDAAILLDPDDVAGFASSIRNVLCSPETAQTMVRKGLEQVRQFTWTRTANETLALYREVAR